MDVPPPRRFLTGALVVAIAAFASLYTGALAWPGIDFWRPWAASHAPAADIYSRAGRERLYQLSVAPAVTKDPTSREQVAAAQSAALDAAFLHYRGIDIVQTPLFLSAVRVFRSDDYERDYRLFLAFSLLCFFAAVFALGRILGFSASLSLVAASALGLLLAAEASELRAANVNNVQLALLAAFLLLQRRSSNWADFASGAVLALGIAFKPNLALLAPAVGLAWVGGRLWRKALTAGAGFALGTLVALGVPAMLLYPSAWRDWLGVAPELLGSGQPLGLGNFALSAIIAEQWGFDASRILLAAGLVALGGAALRPLWAQPSAPAGGPAFERTFPGVAAGAVLLLLSSRLVWVHYLVLATPALLLLARGFMDRGGARSWALALAALPLADGCTNVLLNLGGTFLLPALAQNVSLLVLFAWALGCLWNGGGGPPDHPPLDLR